MQELIKKWRKESDDNYAQETMADAMDSEFFKDCVVAHNAKAKVYEMCANELEAALKTKEEKFTSTNKARQASETYAQIAARMRELASEPCEKGFVPISPETLNEWARQLLPC